jgi:dihydrofolate reductase
MHWGPTKLSLIAAASENGVIGRKNALIWNIPEDLARFKRITIGHPIIVGRRSFESIGKPLEGRRNIVMTRSDSFDPTGRFPGTDLHLAHSPDEALRIALERSSIGIEASATTEVSIGIETSDQPDLSDEVFVIGGGQIFRLFLPDADRIYLTRVHQSFSGDAFFPEIGPEWKVEMEEDHLDAPLPYSFLLYEKRL